VTKFDASTMLKSQVTDYQILANGKVIIRPIFADLVTYSLAIVASFTAKLQSCNDLIYLSGFCELDYGLKSKGL